MKKEAAFIEPVPYWKRPDSRPAPSDARQQAAAKPTPTSMMARAEAILNSWANARAENARGSRAASTQPVEVPFLEPVPYFVSSNGK